MAIERFEDIDAWRAARDLVSRTYEVVARERFSRDFGLRDQIQRAAVSVMANIAEGFDSQTDRAFAQFLGYALRSATEVQSHLYVALDQRYIDQKAFEELYGKVVIAKNLIHGFMRYLRNVEHSTQNLELRT